MTRYSLCVYSSYNNNYFLAYFLYFQFKPMSILFGINMFSNKHDDSEVLAPDSDSDS